MWQALNTLLFLEDISLSMLARRPEATKILVCMRPGPRLGNEIETVWKRHRHEIEIETKLKRNRNDIDSKRNRNDIETIYWNEIETKLN